MKIGIIGAGAVGSIIAREFSKLPADKIDLTVMARTPRDGFTILESGEKTFHNIPVQTTDNIDDKFDVLFIATKTPALFLLQEKIAAITHAQSEIVYVLNGMGYDHMFDQGIPSVVYISGQQHSDYIEHFVNQKIILPDDNFKHIDALIRLIDADPTVNFELLKSANFNKMRYEKLLINIGINSVTALAKNTAKIFENPELILLTRKLLSESIQVVNECNPENIVIDEAFIDDAMAMYESYPREMGTSMYYDVMANKTTEFEHIQKYVYKMKGEIEIDTPVLDMVVTLLHAYEMS